MEWTSVASSLPAEGSIVLVSVGRMWVDVAFYSLGRFSIGMNTVYPDAWMALPRPFRTGKHEKGYHDRKERVEKLIKYGAIKC